MNWFEDYEYPNDHIYAMEKQHDIEVAWEEWEEKQKFKNRLPAIIKVIKPIKNEIEYKPSTIRGAHQTRI